MLVILKYIQVYVLIRYTIYYMKVLCASQREVKLLFSVTEVMRDELFWNLFVTLELAYLLSQFHTLFCALS